MFRVYAADGPAYEFVPRFHVSFASFSKFLREVGRNIIFVNSIKPIMIGWSTFYCELKAYTSVIHLLSEWIHHHRAFVSYLTVPFKP